VIGLVFLFFALVACESRDTERANDVTLAWIGTDPITLADYRSYISRLPDTLKGELAPQRILQGIIDEELIMQEARSRGLDRTPELASFLQRQQQSLAMRILYQREGIEQPEISAEELRVYFARSPYCRKVRFSLLMVEDAEIIPELLEELAVGADFDSLSMHHSRDRRILARGPDMGYHSWGETTTVHEKLTQKAFAMELGEVAGPLQVENGYYLIKLTDIRLIPFEEEREKIEQFVVQERLGRQLMEYYRRLWKKYGLQYEPGGLTALADATSGRLRTIDSTAVVVAYADGSLSLIRCLHLLDTPGWTELRDLEALRRKLDYQIGRQVLVPLEIERLELTRAPPVLEQLERERRRFVTRALKAQIPSRTPTSNRNAVRLYFEKNRKRYALPARVEARRMLVADGISGERIVEQLRAGSGNLALMDRFAPVTYGGEILEEDTPIGQALRGEEGSFHGPLATNSGYTILQILHRHPVRLPELEEVQRQVMADFARDRVDGLFQEFIEDLRTRYAGKIQIDQKGLQELALLEHKEQK
jgi:hypothetical protein